MHRQTHDLLTCRKLTNTCYWARKTGLQCLFWNSHLHDSMFFCIAASDIWTSAQGPLQPPVTMTLPSRTTGSSLLKTGRHHLRHRKNHSQQPCVLQLQHAIFSHRC